MFAAYIQTVPLANPHPDLQSGEMLQACLINLLHVTVWRILHQLSVCVSAGCRLKHVFNTGAESNCDPYFWEDEQIRVHYKLWVMVKLIRQVLILSVSPDLPLNHLPFIVLRRCEAVMNYN